MRFLVMGKDYFSPGPTIPGRVEVEGDNFRLVRGSEASASLQAWAYSQQVGAVPTERVEINSHGESWWPADVEYIRDNWLVQTDADMAYFLGRSIWSVTHRRKSIGLYRPHGPNRYAVRHDG